MESTPELTETSMGQPPIDKSNPTHPIGTSIDHAKVQGEDSIESLRGSVPEKDLKGIKKYFRNIITKLETYWAEVRKPTTNSSRLTRLTSSIVGFLESSVEKLKTAAATATNTRLKKVLIFLALLVGGILIVIKMDQHYHLAEKVQSHPVYQAGRQYYQRGRGHAKRRRV